ncbi:glucosidase 2 subunit beta-like [Elysia marginata]|uniref:Glucosidase 2 subunit beta n=1 Tax=Elysia marginata TaxID=1093978 RepID=A0AAV4G0J5_9GAST|nr:glucosidase 2 subunit beta-like [Elysia marginata]
MQGLCKRKYKTLTLLAVVAGLFYMLQCLSIFRLGELSHARARAWERTNHKTSFQDNEDEQILLTGRKRIVDGEVRMNNGLDEADLLQSRHDAKEDRGAPLKFAEEKHPTPVGAGKGNKREEDETSVERKANEKIENVKDNTNDKSNSKLSISINLRGVHSKDKHLYVVGEDGQFACLSDKKTRIPPQRVNDDFCDCHDGSDEPGTSACPAGSFYCSIQVPGLPPQSISSSKVNDGICDCCDGSDEWAGALLPDSIRIKEGEKLGAVFHAPCSDKCKSIVEIQRKKQLTRERGQKLQRDYIKMAVKDLPNPAKRKKYGPNGVFYSLSKQCFRLRDKAYTYQVCPFSKVEQQPHSGSPTNLGRNAKPVSIEKGQHLLEMVDGDTKLCPFGRARKSKIYMLCDVEEVLLKVTESELCEYTFTLSTPAAC